MNRIAKLFIRILSSIVRWVTELCTIGDPVERAKRDARRKLEQKRKKKLADIQAKLDSGRYEVVRCWRKVKVKCGWKHVPWRWREVTPKVRAVNPRRRRAKRILAEHGVNYNSGRQRRRFRKEFNRAYRVVFAKEQSAAAVAAQAPAAQLPEAPMAAAA